MIGSRFARALAVASLLVVTGVGAAGTASAHSALERTDPADKSTVETLPERLTLTFNQNVLALGSVLKVTGPDGDVTDGKPKVVDNEVRQAITPGSPAGKYNVAWRVTSADGHPISGEFAFTAEAGSAGGEPEPTESATPVAAATSSAAATAEATAPASIEASGDDDADGGSPLVWLLVVVVALLIAAGIWLSRRMSSHDSMNGPPGQH